MRLFKHLPTGSGVGAGSGNAASLLRWFFLTSAGFDFSNAHEGCASLGMDVAFLASGFNLALADGRGELLKGLDENLSLPGVVFFPQWKSGTSEAYALLDRWRENDAPHLSLIDGEEAGSESMRVLRALKNEERAGLLPNDFASCASANEGRYDDIYDVFEKSGALAWGLCGSGSSCFVLFGEKDGGESIPRLLRHLSNRESSRYAWLYKTLVLE
jgi:4-diphosphocytidyl-2-C-methyl-D-erythritol kinase